jgi:hypothetical protein
MRCLTTIVAAATISVTARAGGPCEIDTLVGNDTASGDDAGAAVAVDGSRAVIGAPEDDDAGSSSGAAFVFRRDIDGVWGQEQKLTASDADNGDDYGFAVAIDGDTIVVGSPRDDTPDGDNAGSAYVYRYNAASGQWEEEDRLFADDAEANDRFGTSVAIHGDTIVVGATQEDGAIANAGAGYVFVRSVGTWSQEDKLTDSMASGTNPHLGRSAAVEGDVAVLGAWQDAPAGMSLVGAAVVYRRTGSTWSEEQKLRASDLADFRWFGLGVAISGDVIAVGAYGDRADDLSESGGAYFFRHDGKDWIEEDNVNASAPAADDRFGWSIDLDGACAVIGSGTTAGRAWLLAYDGADWVEQAELETDGAVSSEYGYAVATDGVSIVVGDRGGFDHGGSAIVFTKDACPCPADVDGNDEVDFQDLLLVLSTWGPCPGCPADIDGDDDVDFQDLLLVLAAWGPCAP